MGTLCCNFAIIFRAFHILGRSTALVVNEKAARLSSNASSTTYTKRWFLCPSEAVFKLIGRYYGPDPVSSFHPTAC